MCVDDRHLRYIAPTRLGGEKLTKRQRQFDKTEQSTLVHKVEVSAPDTVFLRQPSQYD